MGRRSKKKKEEGKFSNGLDWILDAGELFYYGIRGVIKLIGKIFD